VVSHVEQAVAARIAAARARIAERSAEREAFAEARRAGVDARNRRKADRVVVEQPAAPAEPDGRPADG
jgi:hypothetical protein